ncbi:MAG TPA: AMP-binding protein [Magnetospirillum sp.]|nr:AMP-binding protein [Magnetospirillum sp.]
MWQKFQRVIGDSAVAAKNFPVPGASKGCSALFAALDHHAGRLALIEPAGRRLSYADMLAAGDGLAAAVRDFAAGRPLVAVLCRNDADCIAGYVGLMRAGAAVLMLHHSIQPAQLDDVLGRFPPAFVYAPNDVAPGGAEAARLGAYVLWRRPGPALDLHPDLSLLLTTSGTTGSRSFVRLSAANLLANARAIARYLEIGGDDRAITTMPLSYSYGLSIVHSHLLQGASLVATEDSVVSAPFWRVLRDLAVTTMGGVPFIYDMLKKLRFARMDLPALKVLTQAGGRMAPELVSEFAESCAASGRRLIVMYGQTEATARISWLPWEQVLLRPGSIGQAIPEGHLWLEAEDGTVIDRPGTVGELVYAGPNVSMGYASVAADLARGDDNGGVLRTGDMATCDEDGYFFIVGRRKRFLKIFGHRVNLDDLERVLHSAGLDCACAGTTDSYKSSHALHSAGLDCACAGTDDDLTIYACGASAEQVRDAVASRTGLTPQMVKVRLIAAIPRAESGKVDYGRLATMGPSHG